MTDKIDLLPMPEGEAFGVIQAWSRDQMRDYARANVAHATAPLQAENERLRAEVAELKRRLEREDLDHGRTIDQRDAAEDALGRMFQAVTGRVAEWSSAWGYTDAIEEVEEHVAALEAAREDAERYRLLRKGAVEDVAVVRGLGAMDYGMSAVVYTYSEEIDGDDLDASIDAAIDRAMKEQA